MQDFTEQLNRPTLFSNVCETANGTYLPYIHPDEAMNVTEACENKFRENIITCKTPDKELFIQEVDGLALSTVSITSRIKGLPQYITVLDKRSCKTVVLPDNVEYVGVSLIDVLKSGMVEVAGGLVEKEIVFNKELLKEKG